MSFSWSCSFSLDISWSVLTSIASQLAQGSDRDGGCLYTWNTVITVRPTYLTMHSNVTIKTVSWPHFSWATLYIFRSSVDATGFCLTSAPISPSISALRWLTREILLHHATWLRRQKNLCYADLIKHSPEIFRRQKTKNFGDFSCYLYFTNQVNSVWPPSVGRYNKWWWPFPIIPENKTLDYNILPLFDPGPSKPTKPLA